MKIGKIKTLLRKQTIRGNHKLRHTLISSTLLLKKATVLAQSLCFSLVFQSITTPQQTPSRGGATFFRIYPLILF